MTACPSTHGPADECGPGAELDPRAERIRRAVLDAGTELLFDRGPDGVTPAAVASAARISRTTLYKYWPTRAELLFDVLEEVEPHPEIELQGDVRDDLLAMLGTYCTGMNDPAARKVFSSVLARAQWDADTREVQLKMEEYALATSAASSTRQSNAGSSRTGSTPGAKRATSWARWSSPPSSPATRSPPTTSSASSIGGSPPSTTEHLDRWLATVDH